MFTKTFVPLFALLGVLIINGPVYSQNNLGVTGPTGVGGGSSSTPKDIPPMSGVSVTPSGTPVDVPLKVSPAFIKSNPTAPSSSTGTGTGTGKPAFGVAVTPSGYAIPLGCEQWFDVDVDRFMSCIMDGSPVAFTTNERAALKYVCENRMVKDLSVLHQLSDMIDNMLWGFYNSKSKKNKNPLELAVDFVGNNFGLQAYELQRLTEIQGYIGKGYGLEIMKRENSNGGNNIEVLKKLAYEFNDETIYKPAMQAIYNIMYGEKFGGQMNVSGLELANKDKGNVNVIDNTNKGVAGLTGPTGIASPDGTSDPNYSTADLEKNAEGPAATISNDDWAQYSDKNVAAKDHGPDHFKLTMPAEIEFSGVNTQVTESNDPVEVLYFIACNGGYTENQKKSVRVNTVIDYERAERGRIEDKKGYAVQLLVSLGAKDALQRYVNSNPSNDDAENLAADVLGLKKPHGVVSWKKVNNAVGTVADFIKAGSYPKVGQIGELAQTEQAVAETEIITAQEVFAANKYEFSAVEGGAVRFGGTGNGTASLVLEVPPMAAGTVPSLAYQTWTIPSVTNQILIQDLILTARIASVAQAPLTMIDRTHNIYKADFDKKTISPIQFSSSSSANKVVRVYITTKIGIISYEIPVATDAQVQSIIDFLKALSVLNPTVNITVSINNDAKPVKPQRQETFDHPQVQTQTQTQTVQPGSVNPLKDVVPDVALSKLEQALQHSGLTLTQQTELMNIFKNGASLAAPILIRGRGMTTRVEIYNTADDAIALRISTTMEGFGAPAVTLDRIFAKGADGKVKVKADVAVAGEEAVTLTAEEEAILTYDVDTYTEMCGRTTPFL